MNDAQLAERTKAFALRIIRLVASLPRSPIADVIGKQLLRSGTSVGANYREARRARSKADFAAKAGICAQESDESLYWLELLADSALVRKPLLIPLRREANELVAIFTSSVKTARQNKKAKSVL